MVDETATPEAAVEAAPSPAVVPEPIPVVKPVKEAPKDTAPATTTARHPPRRAAPTVPPGEDRTKSKPATEAKAKVERANAAGVRVRTF
jgi:hypothetical protein